MLDSALVAVFGSISETMLGAEACELSPSEPPFDDHALVARIEFTGCFHGALTATFSEPLARALTSVLMHRRFEESSAADVSDALGELVNIAAGNLKGLLPGTCQLSLPEVQRQRAIGGGAPSRSLGRVRIGMLGSSVYVELSSYQDVSPC